MVAVRRLNSVSDGKVGVWNAPPTPIGIASRVGRTDRGLAVWGLRVRGAAVLGRWVIIDRRPAIEPVRAAGGNPAGADAFP